MSEPDSETDRSNSVRCSFKLADLKLECDDLSKISQSQDGMPIFIFFLYRFLVAGYFLAFFIYLMVDTIQKGRGDKFFIYLTNWTYLEVTLYLILASVNVVFDLIHNRRISRSAKRHRKPRPFRFQLQWLFFNIAITISIIITLVYWPFLRPMLIKDHDGEKTPLVVDLSIHLFPTVFALLDLLVTKIIVKFAHVFYPLIYMSVYGLFAFIYWLAGGTDPYGNPYIYPIFDYGNNPGIAMASIFGALLAIFLSHGFVTLLYTLRAKYLDPRVVPEVTERRNSDRETESLLPS